MFKENEKEMRQQAKQKLKDFQNRHVSKFSSERVKKAYNRQNNRLDKIAMKLYKGQRANKLDRNSLSTMRSRHSLKDKPIELIDTLKGSHLVQHRPIITDVLKY